MNLTQEQLDGLGVALNEATLLGLEVDPSRLLAAATFGVLTLPPEGPEPADRRRQFIFRPVGRVAASLRHGRWGDEAARVEPFAIEHLLEVVQSFGGQPIYGWQFLDDQGDFSSWSGRLSLEFMGDASATEHFITLFQEGSTPHKHLDIRLWFRILRFPTLTDSQFPSMSLLLAANAGGMLCMPEIRARKFMVLSHSGPNQTLEPTASRCTALFFMASTHSRAAARALARSSSALCR